MVTRFLTGILLFISANVYAQSDVQFFKQLQSLKGKTVQGKVIYMADTVTTNDFWGKKLAFTVAEVNGELRMPFIVGENRSRTWFLRKIADGLELKHDHRHSDGKVDSISNYGGRSDSKIGTSDVQYFPADEFTARLLPIAAGNRWIMQFSPDKKKFFYILERDKVLRFKAEFKL